MAMPAGPQSSVPRSASGEDAARRQHSGRAAVHTGCDPLARVLELGRREVRVGFAIGLSGALMVHGAGAATGMRQLGRVAAFAKETRAFVIERLYSEYDVEVRRDKPPPPPESEPEPEQEPEQPPAPNKATNATQTPVQEQPPAAAQAGKVLTAEPDPDAPLDFTGDGFVVGNADRYAGGVTAGSGTSPTAVRNQRARPEGVAAGRGKRKPTGQPKSEAQTAAVDRSRPARPRNMDWTGCGFPAQADVEQVNYARVVIVVTVGPDGSPKSVVIQSDPGYGFGAQARQCAMRRAYLPGLDRSGQPVARTTPPITVTFTR
jgi:protein TonB